MTSHSPPFTDSTSANGSLFPLPTKVPVLLVGLALAGTGTSSALAPSHVPGAAVSRVEERTSAGAPLVRASAGSAIGELRRLSGLTWERLAELFGTSRRSLHLWASGKPMKDENRRRLDLLLELVRTIDRGTAAANRIALLEDRDGEGAPFDLLVRGDHERPLALLGVGKGRRPVGPSVSARAMAERAPRPPAELVDALQDRVHPASGRLLRSKPLRAGRGT